MSGFPSKPPTTISNVFNPSFFDQSSDSLTIGEANALYTRLNDPRIVNSLSASAADALYTRLDDPRIVNSLSASVADALYTRLDDPRIVDGLTQTVANAFYIRLDDTILSPITGITLGAPQASKVLTLNASSQLVGNLTMTGTLSAASITGAIQTAAQPNITSLGNQNSILFNPTNRTLSIGITSTNCIWATTLDRYYGMRQPDSNNFVMLCYSAGGTYNDVISWAHPTTTLTIAGSLTATNLTGTLQTAAQPNITSLGTIANLTATDIICNSLTLNGTAIDSSTFANIDALTGVSAGTVSASKVIIAGTSKSVNGISNLTLTGSIYMDTSTLQSIYFESFQLNNTSSGLTLNNPKSSQTTGCDFTIKTGNNAAYKDYMFLLQPFTQGSKSIGFYLDNTSTTDLHTLWCKNTNFTLSSRNLITDTPNLVLRTDGCVLVAKSTQISTNHRLEVKCVIISNTGSTVALSGSPNLGIYHSTQGAGTHTFLTFGRDRTTISDYILGGYYSGATSSANNYCVLTSKGSNGGLTVNGFGHVRIAGSGFAHGSASLAAFEVVGTQTSISVPSGFSYTSGGQAGIGGGSVSICGYFGGNLWIQGGNLYVTSDARLKKDIQSITTEESLRLLKLNPVKYHWKNGEKTQQHGLVAQEVAEHLPQLVNLVPNKDMEDGVQRCLSYEKFIPYLIKLCQTQQAQLEKLVSLLPQSKRESFALGLKN